MNLNTRTNLAFGGCLALGESTNVNLLSENLAYIDHVRSIKKAFN